MSDPNSIRNQPASMSQFRRMPNDDDHDHGGVHTNSGIPNRAFYGAAMRIGGHAWEKAGRIWYDTLLAGMKPTTDFAGFAAYTVDMVFLPVNGLKQLSPLCLRDHGN